MKFLVQAQDGSSHRWKWLHWNDAVTSIPLLCPLLVNSYFNAVKLEDNGEQFVKILINSPSAKLNNCITYNSHN